MFSINMFFGFLDILCSYFVFFFYFKALVHYMFNVYQFNIDFVYCFQINFTVIQKKTTSTLHHLLFLNLKICLQVNVILLKLNFYFSSNLFLYFLDFSSFYNLISPLTPKPMLDLSTLHSPPLLKIKSTSTPIVSSESEKVHFDLIPGLG